jgi:hypothetical protein
VAATRVESASGTQVADLGGEMGVRGPLRDAISVLAQACDQRSSQKLRS